MVIGGHCMTFIHHRPVYPTAISVISDITTILNLFGTNIADVCQTLSVLTFVNVLMWPQ